MHALVKNTYLKSLYDKKENEGKLSSFFQCRLTGKGNTLVLVKIWLCGNFVDRVSVKMTI